MLDLSSAFLFSQNFYSAQEPNKHGLYAIFGIICVPICACCRGTPRLV